MNQIATIGSSPAVGPINRADTIAAAVEAYERALAINPADGAALLMLGEFTLQLGEVDRSLEKIRSALEVRPSDPVAHFMLGRALQLSGDPAGAEAGYSQAIALSPDLALAHGNLAELLLGAGKYREALKAAQRAALLDPDFPAIHLTIGQIFVALLNWQDAEAPLKKALEGDPGHPNAHNMLGHVQYYLGKYEDASRCFGKTLELKPDDAVAWAGLGAVEQARGRFDEAAVYLSRAVEIDPNLGEAHCALAMCRRAKNGEAELTAIANILANDTLVSSHRVSAGFALGKRLDDEGRFDEAFLYYRQANQIFRDEIQGSEREFKAAGIRNRVRQISTMFAPEIFRKYSEIGNSSERPVFVTGLYRTGTTLTEQILSSHSKVFGAGELQDIGLLRNIILPKMANNENIDAKSIGKVLDIYLEKLSTDSKSTLRGVDKHPDNVFSIGLIALLFPKAKIIYCHRDPRDNVLSCYFQRFSEYMAFSNDLADCTHHYLETERLAAHWAKTLPIPILHVQYETLVDDLEGQARRMIDFLGLDWEPACLNYFETERTVITPSAWGVRQPIYASSVARWRNYERHLDPLFEVLSGAGLDARKSDFIGFTEVQAAVG